MHITLNGEHTHFPETLSLRQMLEGLQLDPDKIAVERNLEIIPHSAYEKTWLEEGDVIEIVHFIGGGHR